MDKARLSQAIEPLVGKQLAREIVADFAKLRRDVATGTLERTSCGKFVESFVQCLQKISTGKYAPVPKVDNYLCKQAEGDTALPDGLRLCASRVARSIYTIRNKRNIAHKGAIDPNCIDLQFTYHGAAWIMAELVRCASGITMEEAGSLIKLVGAPIGTVVEEIDGVPIVQARVSMRSEILILLHIKHPEPVTLAQLVEWIGKDRRAIRSRLSELRSNRLTIGDGQKGFRLTSPGYAMAKAEIESLQQ